VPAVRIFQIRALVGDETFIDALEHPVF
jgi:hypothetical protein